MKRIKILIICLTLVLPYLVFCTGLNSYEDDPNLHARLYGESTENSDGTYTVSVKLDVESAIVGGIDISLNYDYMKFYASTPPVKSSDFSSADFVLSYYGTIRFVWIEDTESIKTGTLTLFTVTFKPYDDTTNGRYDFHLSVISLYDNSIGMEDFTTIIENILVYVGGPFEICPSELHLDVGCMTQLVTNRDEISRWESFDPSIVTVDMEGNIIALKPGSTIIVATFQEEYAVCLVTVLAFTISSDMTLIVGDWTTLDSNRGSVSWESDHPDIVSVTDQGSITAVKAGSATITARAGEETATCTVTVEDPLTISQDNIKLIIGAAAKLSASKQVTWHSSDESVATIDQDGNISAVKAGSAKITAYHGYEFKSCDIIVEDHLSVSPQNVSLVVGATAKLNANKQTGWSSENFNIVTVDQSGNIRAVGAGSTRIKAQSGDETAYCDVTVSNVPNNITSGQFAVSNGVLSKITAGASVDSLINGINEKQYIKVFDKDGKQVTSGAAATGMTVRLMDGNTVKQSMTVVVTGDINGDGSITITDLIAAKSKILNKSDLTGCYNSAADTNVDGNVSITDFIQIKAHILGKESITGREAR